MLHADVEHLPFAGAVFDFVLCSHVLDYVTDDVGALREIRQVLKDGGVAILEQTYLTDRPTDEWGGPRHEQLDRIRQYGAGVGYRVGQTLRLGFDAVRYRRQSSDFVLREYDGLRFGASISYGLPQ